MQSPGNQSASHRTLKEDARIQALKEIFDNQIGAKRIKIMLEREDKSKLITIPSQLDIKKITPSHKRDQ